ncbi:anchored repeat-type ABC transporter ATP-binding subunit [Antribacter gilvus]|uniref:anchored repeat-type ABC transporter ATP-binding subunit n=1 Tax=Antribacter gilvus TaxID=2304675 RepID=UPI000F798060|nr:anchored repeat-type ABC transporter ATP-binding subunit [Antribacter gilvus]
MTATATRPPGTDAAPVTSRQGLEVGGLAVGLGGRQVLHDVDLRVAPGELVGLVGPNGAGKTTLLRTVLGLVPQGAGRVEVAGRAARRARARIGYVPQRHEFAWDFPVTVSEAVLAARARTIGWFRRPGVDDYRAVRRALDRVSMTDLRDRPVGELSGGQRQRVLVARALVTEPSVLLLDEPFTGLDVPSQELLMDLFAGLARDGAAVLMTTHDLVGAVHGCDRLYLLDRTVVASGTPAELSGPEPWQRAFRISEGSPLLAALAAAVAASAPRGVTRGVPAVRTTTEDDA